MNRRNIALHLAVGLVAGLVATRVNDHAQRALYRITPEQAKAREPAPLEPTSLVAARKTAAKIGLPTNPATVKRLKNVIHYGLGSVWGAVYALLRRHSRMTPLGAGTVTGATLSLIIDEAVCPAIGFSQPSHRYPTISHLRGFATHLVYGLALAATAESLYRLAGQAPRVIRKAGRQPRARIAFAAFEKRAPAHGRGSSIVQQARSLLRT